MPCAVNESMCGNMTPLDTGEDGKQLQRPGDERIVEQNM